jgi:hypothetical protein
MSHSQLTRRQSKKAKGGCSTRHKPAQSPGKIFINARITIHKERKMDQQQVKYQEARKRVAALKKFYIHASVYVCVNLFLFLLNITVSPDSLWFYWPLLGWGIAIVLHALSVFGSKRPFGADWEEKKIAELMKE